MSVRFCPETIQPFVNKLGLMVHHHHGVGCQKEKKKGCHFQGQGLPVLRFF